MEYKKHITHYLIVLLFLAGAAVYGQSPRGVSSYPRIANLNMQDVQFKQFQSDVESAYRRLAALERTARGFLPIAEDLTIFSYQVKDGEDIFKLAARCNIHYAAISTLNRLEHPSALKTGSVILLPAVPGLFVPETPGNDVERIMTSSRDLENGIPINIRKDGKVFSSVFIPGADFSQTERAFYLNTSFRFPLRTYRLTSSFGSRINPVTGNPSFHEGLDLAAPTGTEVFATRSGIVTEAGEDSIFGKYIIIRHDENWVSLYGHLSEILVPLQRPVQSGTLIGKVGSTGQSTGPHLHFELRQNGRAQDPGKYLFIEGKL